MSRSKWSRRAIPGTVLSALVLVSLSLAVALLGACGSGGSGEGEEGPVALQSDGGGADGAADLAGGCQNECDAKGDRVCTDEETVERCIMGPDGCLDLVVDVECPSYKECQSGTCTDRNTECSDRCTAGAPPRCNREGAVVRCDDHDGDGCFEWGNATTCGAGSSCDDETGACEPVECTDECTMGDTECEGELVRRCVENRDGCLVFSSGESCGQGEVCSGGSCQPETSCEDECNGAICTASGQIRRCSDVDGDGCTELESASACPGQETCRQGECVATSTCQDQCPDGEKICVNNGISECADHDGDGCVEFDNPQSCPGNETCVQTSSGEARCETPDTGGDVVINEFLHDPLGPEVRGSGSNATSPTFIELGGPGGLDISGYSIELVNGANGQTYATISLPVGASLDGTGYAVVSMQRPNAYFTQTAPQFTNVYKLIPPYQSGIDGVQNGPDNIVLKDDAGNVVDAVGYGNFGSGTTFQGEGTPVSAVASGRSLGRDDKADSDDNSADFTSYFPTPGLENSDLLINEVYVNQPGFDDRTQTFVEIAAPIPGWEDFVLDGYVLHAINGYDGEDYIPAGGAGVKLLGHKLHESPTDDGYFVICNQKASSPPAGPKCNVAYDGVDLHNGPDNFVLRYNGREVDAMGYGSFGSDETFVGEDRPAEYSHADAGQSLSRWPLPNPFFDFDDNYLDFWKTQPTPGETNNKP